MIEIYQALIDERARRWPKNNLVTIFCISDEEAQFVKAIDEEWQKLSDEERRACGAKYVCFACGRATKQEPSIIEGREFPSYCGNSSCISDFVARVDNELGVTS